MVHLTTSTVEEASRPGRGDPHASTAPGIVDRLLRVPLFLKIILANVAIAAAAVIAALLLADTLTEAVLGRSMAPTLAIFVAAVLALTTVLNAVVVRLALSPLVYLAEAAERVREGDLSARARLSRVADERTRSLVILFNRMMDTLQAGRRRQKELARRILDAEERERERIAHELYAGPAQSLAGVMVRLSLAARRRASTADEGNALEEEIREELAAALEEVRSLARRLRPPELGELGVRAALEAHARTLTEGRDMRVSVRGDLHQKGLHPETSTVLFRILQEAVTNSVLHSGGHNIEVLFTPKDGRLVAEVRDDGNGFDPVRQLRTPPSGVGISGMQERASYAGGTVTVASSEGSGTRVRVELPWKGAPWAGEGVYGAQVAAELGILEQEPPPYAIA